MFNATAVMLFLLNVSKLILSHSNLHSIIHPNGHKAVTVVPQIIYGRPGPDLRPVRTPAFKWSPPDDERFHVRRPIVRTNQGQDRRPPPRTSPEVQRSPPRTSLEVRRPVVRITPEVRKPVLRTSPQVRRPFPRTNQTQITQSGLVVRPKSEAPTILLATGKGEPIEAELMIIEESQPEAIHVQDPPKVISKEHVLEARMDMTTTTTTESPCPRNQSPAVAKVIILSICVSILVIVIICASSIAYVHQMRRKLDLSDTSEIVRAECVRVDCNNRQNWMFHNPVS